MLRRIVKGTGLAVAASAGGCVGYVCYDPGLRREAEFWWFAAPVVARYIAVPYCYAEDETAAKYEELHKTNAPRALEAILSLRGLYIKFGQATHLTCLPDRQDAT